MALEWDLMRLAWSLEKIIRSMIIRSILRILDWEHARGSFIDIQ